ncbi:hypothetical protein GOTRE_060_01000 [Gordonia terrae NBRC 100016]|uniref:Uncharacterized protein n=1 Tax=Gordonia terrae NBRC 100016 TaxID=1089454 RepID=A0ABQ0HE78_9ACTN|nr:hypothetical protein GOTRE_060_01000 [Gordonia terrae NBRC 100016]
MEPLCVEPLWADPHAGCGPGSVAGCCGGAGGRVRGRSDASADGTGLHSSETSGGCQGGSPDGGCGTRGGSVIEKCTGLSALENCAANVSNNCDGAPESSTG